MRKNKVTILCAVFFIFVAAPLLRAQDVLPAGAHPDTPLRMPGQTKEMRRSTHRIPMHSNPMPADFFHSAENVITDETHSLTPFFKKLNEGNEPVRVVHIGDSHVRGHVYPYAVRRGLEADFGSEAVVNDSVTYRTSGLACETGEAGIVYHIIGVNGATNVAFSAHERVNEIAALHPDLIILSFGTNEAHSYRYGAQAHEAQIDSLITLLKEACPGALFLLTTPPGAYIGRRRVRTVNPRTATVARVIKDYARKHQMAVWDMYTIVGGKSDACRNWTKHRMIRLDGIHFTIEGYQLQGNLLHQAFIKAYNEYVGSGLE